MEMASNHVKLAAAAAAPVKENGDQQKQGNHPSIVPHSLLRLLRMIILDAPLVIAVFLWFSSIWLQKFYEGPVTELVDTYRRANDYDDFGYIEELTPDITYYGRQCGAEDITTNDSNDLVVPQDATPEEAADIMMEHGAVLIKDILSNETVQELRDYLETRNEIRKILPWTENFWDGINRLSLGLGVMDHPVIGKALEEMSHHETLQRTVEGIVGPDPAVVEISTLTTIHGAEEQRIHTDSDFFGSSLLYSRTFLHSYTLFMALQDTTGKMGATTVCPGSHWCANEDLGDVCLENGAFEASSNGKTGMEGVLHRGSGMMFNQNIWHRGPANDDPDFPINRVMFIVTFVTRRELENGDLRQQGLGTYYYQRWNMWGHTFNDLKNAAKLMVQPWAALKAIGFWKPSNTRWGILWFDHAARQMANHEDFFADYELPGFIDYLRSINYPEFLAPDEEEYDTWYPYIKKLLENAQNFLEKIHKYASALYLGFFTVIALLSPKSQGSQPSRFVFFKRFLVIHAVLGLLCYLGWYHMEHSYFAARIETRKSYPDPFPRNVTMDHLEKTTIPDRMDVLIGSRFDAEFLASFDRVLDYHPGNKRFASVLKQLPDESLLHEYMTQPHRGVVPRFLQQDWRTGYWTVMNDDQMKQTLQRSIMEEKSSLRKKLGKHLRNILADSRFGLSRNNVMGRDMTPKFVEKWENVVFGASCKSSQKTIPSRQWKQFAPLTQVPKTVSLDVRSNDLINQKSLKEGDRVLVFDRGATAWYEATVIDISSRQAIEVMSTDGEYEMVPFDAIIPFYSYVEGDEVEIELEEKEFFRGVVVRAHPLGRYDVYVKEDDSIQYDWEPMFLHPVVPDYFKLRLVQRKKDQEKIIGAKLQNIFK